MNRRPYVIALVAVCVAVLGAAAFYLYIVLRQGRQPAQTETHVGVQTAPVLEPSPEGGLVSDVPPAAEIQPGETTEPPPPPPPVFVNEMNTQGLRRVDFNPPIGDIFRIVYDRGTDTLLMAVLEPDGTKSIWRMIGDKTIERVLKENARPGEIFLGMDSQGIVYAGFADPGNLYRSEDRGTTWELVSNDIDGAFWNIADDSYGTLWGALHAYNKAIVYRSYDNGKTWAAWKDFQQLYPEYAVTYRDGDDRLKLRHLHDIAYSEGRLFVGVGDVARFTLISEDRGETWRQVWSEGFTAHALKPDGSGILMGPDRLQAHGLAFYDFRDDTTREVWSPVPYGYSGYTYSMMEMDDVYYAAFHTETNEVESFSGRSGVIISPDAKRWYPFLQIDPLTNWARTDIYLAKRRNWSGWITLNGALYIFEAPIGRWFEVHGAFGG